MRKFIGTIVMVAVAGFGVWVYVKVRDLQPGPPAYGVTFSKPYAEALGLDWRETYRALLDDLHVRKIRLPIYWNEVERAPHEFIFADYDWLIEEARKRQAELIVAAGRKLPRWPECHVPDWAQGLDEKSQQDGIRAYLIETVNRYKDNRAVAAWQIENEPFLSFGPCPSPNRHFFDQEVSLVRGLDSRPIVVTDSGELSLWISAARRADWFGTTMYRHVWSRLTGYLTYPLPPGFFKVKRVITQLIARPEKMLVIELQAEPWLAKQPATQFPVAEQLKHFNVKRFNAALEYAKASGFDTFYLWGAEWWYWLKTKAGRPELWETAKRLF